MIFFNTLSKINFKAILIVLLTFYFTVLKAQELNCSIEINSLQVTGVNQQVFQSLQTTLNEFVNQRVWTNQPHEVHERRVDCSMNIIIESEKGSNQYGASIQVSSSRPVFQSVYSTPILNIKDNDFTFSYVEFEPLVFNENLFQSNLVSVISYYIYLVLAIDADTFSLSGGEDYYKKAFQIAELAQQNGISGWENKRNTRNRFTLVEQLLSPSNKSLRNFYYQYHLKGFDVLLENKRKAKNMIAQSIYLLERLYNRKTNNFLIRFVMDAKSR